MRTNFVLPVVFVVFIQMLSILVLLPSHVAYEAIAEESAVLADWYGTSVADWTVVTANDKYQSAFIDSGFREWGQERFTVRTETDNALGNRIGKIFNPIMRWMGDRFNTFLNMNYLLLMRSLELLLWVPWMLCLLVPALIDGAMGRKIAQTDFAYVSPVRQQAALTAVKVSVAGTFVLFFLPIALNPLIVPAALFVTAVSMGLAMRNLHKRL